MKAANWQKKAAAVILVLTFFLWFLFSILGMLNGVPREINNIIMIFIMAALGLVALRRPLLGGILLTAFALIISMYFLLYNDNLSTALVGMVSLGAPAVVAGLLFIEADWTSKKRN